MSLFGPLHDLQGGLRDAPVWGIDPSTRRFCLAVVLPEDFTPRDEIADHVGPGWRILTRAMPPVRDHNEPRRLSEGRIVMDRLYRDAAEAYGLPIYTIIEQPFARPGNVHPQSYYFLGLGMESCDAFLGMAGIIDVMGPGTWKKLALGAGNGAAKKPQILRWAREEMGYTGVCRKCLGGRLDDGSPIDVCKEGSLAHDEADALAIAVGAARQWVNGAVVAA